MFWILQGRSFGELYGGIIFVLVGVLMIGDVMSEEDSFYFTDSRRMAIFRADFQSRRHERININGFRNPIAVAHDEVTNDIYITERGSATPTTEKFLARYNSNGGQIPRFNLPRSSVPDGVAVDPISGLVYLSDTGQNVILALTRDLRYNTIIIKDDLDQPRGLALDPFKGLMFWSDWSAVRPHIGRAKMDGSSQWKIVTRDLGWVNAITLDIKDGLLYWADAQLSKIERCDTSGNGRKLLLMIEPRAHFFGLVVDETHIYWTEWTKDHIRRIVKAGGDMSLIEDVGEKAMANTTRMNGLALAKKSRYISGMGTNACASNNGGCQHICLPTGTMTKVCRCTEGYALNSDGRRCSQLTFARGIFLSDSGRRGIYISDLNQNELIRLQVYGHHTPRGVVFDSSARLVFWVDAIQRFVASACFGQSKNCANVIHRFPRGSVPEGIAVDTPANILYVVDSGAKQILSMSYSGFPSILVENLDKPRGIALDKVDRMLYWSDWGIEPKIARTEMDSGVNIENFVTINIVWPNSIAIDETGRQLYWVDGRLGRIERIKLDGTERELIKNDPNVNYVGITLGNGILYWTVANKKYFYSISLSTKEEKQYGGGLLQNVLDLDYFEIDGPVNPTTIGTSPRTTRPLIITPYRTPPFTTGHLITTLPTRSTTPMMTMRPPPNMTFSPMPDPNDTDMTGSISNSGDNGLDQTVIISIAVVISGVVLASIIVVAGIVCYKRMTRATPKPVTREETVVKNMGFENDAVHRSPIPDDDGLYSDILDPSPPSVAPPPPPSAPTFDAPPDIIASQPRNYPYDNRMSNNSDDYEAPVDNHQVYNALDQRTRPPLPLPPSVYQGLR